MRALENRKFRSICALADFIGADRTAGDAGKNDFRAGTFSDFLAEGIVRIQDHRPARSDRFGERAFFGRDGFA